MGWNNFWAFWRPDARYWEPWVWYDYEKLYMWREVVVKKSYLSIFSPHLFVFGVSSAIYALLSITITIIITRTSDKLLPVHPSIAIFELVRETLLKIVVVFRRLLETHCFQQAFGPPGGSPKCLRFGLWLALCTLNINLLTYLRYHPCCTGSNLCNRRWGSSVYVLQICF